MARTLADLEREVAGLTARIERGTYYRKHAQEHRAGGRDVLPASGGTALTVREVDGVPSVANVDTIEVSNGTLTDLGGGDVRITTGGGGSVATDTIWDAKGDLAAGTGPDTAVRLAVGANDTILMADSAQAAGLKYAGPGTPVAQLFADVAAEGTTDGYARTDHRHGMPILRDEGTAMTARAAMNFLGAGIKLVDDAAGGETEVIAGAYYDAIVDDDDTNAKGKGNVYATIEAARAAGAKHIFVRKAGDTSDITILSTDAVSRIIGASTQAALVPVNIRCENDFVSFEFLTFATAIAAGTGKTLTFAAANCLALGCLFTGSKAASTVLINNAAGITAAATVIDYDTETGSFLARCMAMIHRASNSDREWVMVTAKTATQLTVVRASNMTPGQVFDDNDTITSMSEANLIIDAANCQVVQCVWNSPSGLGAGLWLTDNSDGARVTSNQFLTMTNRSCILAGHTAGGPDNISLVGNVFDTHSGEEAVVLVTDSGGSGNNIVRFWNVAGNTFTGAYAAGALAVRAETWTVSGNTFNGGTRNTRTALINQVGGIAAGDTTIPYDTEAGVGTLPNKGWVQIENELLWYGNKTATHLRSCRRGVGGTTAAAHADNTTITNRTQCALNFLGSQDALRFVVVSGNGIANTHTIQAFPAVGTVPFVVWSGNAASVAVTYLYSSAGSGYSGNAFRSVTVDFQNRTAQGFSFNALSGSMVFTNVPSDLLAFGLNTKPAGAASKHTLPTGDVITYGRAAGDTGGETHPFTNKTGANTVAQHVCIADTANDNAFVETATGGAERVLGVIQEAGIADASPALVQTSGCASVLCDGTVNRGDYLETSTTAGIARASGAVKTLQSFAIALTARSGAGSSAVKARLL